MWASYRNSSQSQLSNKKPHKQEKEWFAVGFKPENLIPGLVIGFIVGMLLDLSKPAKNLPKKKSFLVGRTQQQCSVSDNGDQELKMVLVVRQDLKMGSGKVASQCAHAATGMYAELMQSGIIPCNMCSCAQRKRQDLIVGKISVKSISSYNNYNNAFSNFISIMFRLMGLYYQFKVKSLCIHCSDRFLLRKWEQCGQPKIVLTCKNQNEMNKLKEAAESIGLPTFVVADAGRTQISAGSKTVLAIGPGAKESVDSVTGKQRLL
ncbi:hypothetical protein Dsin_017700 [Dipteronia sinensis]|uniref:peptidyl-tRNA hydrolase n=1 Tax=Dipteronia sinensis TaxID=43782 RepID=A0AAE0AFJ1_9ROSI|nr:hypothetical protein Dsin_017700 [Dipteronia sinensis]